ncbi:hypothetical protein BC835DRAFT_1424051 [Cytidiella melzeri]|nr:hypothetical protein BC835DRAFT_1424051 [Cytidiella melzeri]
MQNLHRFPNYKAEIVAEFEHHFPRDYLAKVFEGSGRKKKYLRNETPEEAQERTARRETQLRTWLDNHKGRLVQAMKGEKQPLPKFLDIQAYHEAPAARTRSARDIFISENGQVRQESDRLATKDGVNSSNLAKLQARRNKVYTKAIAELLPDEWRVYFDRSEQEKVVKKAERDIARTKTKAAESLSLPERAKLLTDLEFTVEKTIAEWLSQTGTEMVLMFGGEDGAGEIRKWL